MIETEVGRKPEWLKIKIQTNDQVNELKSMMRERKLNSVCEEAKCPNIHECWSNRTATFMILGKICTRACRFCAVTTGLPNELDLEEPGHVAQSVLDMGLKHVVITSVARDDLADEGSSVFAQTIRAVRELNPFTGIEVLIPDFGGRKELLQIVLEAKPDILNHNMETVARLSDQVRAKAKYPRSLQLLRNAKEIIPGQKTKSGIMLGLGETIDEIRQTMLDLREVDCNILTVGQYLQPTKKHLPIRKYYTPDEFKAIKVEGMAMGFSHVESGPMVRSSYHAHEQVKQAEMHQ
ncbi:lipoyl synthase [Paenibacillus psychroresistens]|uniref:Lipoyl synthase n=1 Tax=Paenibacillus psychroresistens TaxID=1778678 RepID=A0A6B8RPP8_9BACL|nr:lipoyl synthase [Paenibacillus psychroresistens]QGQ97989.1 lipoyl synthase [Paenibacillus psychroresistens]